jgi:hypothetical protein
MGVFMPTAAKAERIWYKNINGITFLFDSFRDKYPWIDWEDVVTGSGGTFGGYIPGIVIKGNTNDEIIKDDFMQKASFYGYEVDYNNIEVNSNGNDSIATTSLRDISELTDAEIADGVNVALLNVNYSGNNGRIENGLYTVALEGEITNIKIKISSNGNSSNPICLYINPRQLLFDRWGILLLNNEDSATFGGLTITIIGAGFSIDGP